MSSPSLRWRLILSALLLSLPSVSFAWVTPAAPAAPGELDPSFAGFKFFGPTFTSFPRGLAVQSNGKIVVLTTTPNAYEFALHRFHPDGTRDAFNVTHAYVRFPNTFTPQDVAVQSDGSIIVGGDAGSIELARITSTGALDDTFGSEGRVSDADAGRQLGAVLVQPDGKIVAAGYDEVGGDYDFVITRYHPSGARDNTFGGDGKVTLGFGGDDIAWDLALMGDGRLVALGNKQGNGLFEDDDIAVARLMPDGTPDSTFDNDGKLSIGFGDDEYGRAVALQADGKIVVLGRGDSTTLLTRLNLNSSFDGTFNGNGKLTIPVDDLVELAVLPDNRLLLVGTHTSPDGDNKLALHRLNASGAPDTTFDYDGTAWLDFYDDDRGAHVSLLPDGRILAAGSINSALNLVRLWPDGAFDSGGKQTHAVLAPPVYTLGTDVSVSALAVKPDGTYLVAGEITNPSGFRSDAFVARFDTNGQLDTSFGSQGLARLWIGRYNAARALALQPDGKIVIAGFTDFNGGWIEFLVARFHPNGTPDTSFGENGHNHRLASFATGAGVDQGLALALAPDGKIIVAGNAWNGTAQIWGVARWNSNGTPDTTFGPNHDGLALVNFNGPNNAKAVVVQPDGKVIIGGDYNGDFFLQRLLANGLPDPSFGINGGGYNFTDMGGDDSITALALAPNGWLYAAGYSWRGGADDFALAQYTPDGLLPVCPSGETCPHWPDGKRMVSLGGSDSAYALALRGDNQLVAAGCSDYHMAAAQLSTTEANPQPLLFHTDFVGHFDCAFGVQFSASQNQIVLAGLQAYNSDGFIALARFQTTAIATPPTPTPPTPEPSSPYRLFLPGVLRQP